MDRKKILIMVGVLIIVVLGVLYFPKSREDESVTSKVDDDHRKYVAEQTEAEFLAIRETLDQQNENRWISVEKVEGNYRIRAEREEEINLPETEYLTKEVLVDGDTKTIVYVDREGQEKERISIEYYDAPKLAILIDDVGMSLGAAEYFGEIDKPLTFATIPFLPKSREGTKKLKEYGFEVILHMPMAGSSDSLNKRTEGILLTGMNKNEIYDAFDRALEDVGSVDGFNNHMGSRFTSNEIKMRELLGYAKRKNLYFIDSNTAIKNMGYPISKEIGVPTFYCSHFLDNSREMEDMKKELSRAARMAAAKERALVIGHYHKGMAQAIKEMLPYIEEQGVKLVFARELLETN